jgi:hypothetical protein
VESIVVRRADSGRIVHFSPGTRPTLKSYDRIAGYFCGSILETVGEAIELVRGQIRVVGLPAITGGFFLISGGSNALSFVIL